MLNNPYTVLLWGKIAFVVAALAGVGFLCLLPFRQKNRIVKILSYVSVIGIAVSMTLSVAVFLFIAMFTSI